MGTESEMVFDIEALKRAAMAKYKIKLDDTDPAFSLVALNVEILRQMRDQIVGEAVEKIQAAVIKMVNVKIQTHEDDFKKAISAAENSFVGRLNEYLEGQEENLQLVFEAEIGKFRRAFKSHGEVALSSSADSSSRPIVEQTIVHPGRPSLLAAIGGPTNLAMAIGMVLLFGVGLGFVLSQHT